MTERDRASILSSQREIWALGIEDTFVPQPDRRTGRILDEYVLTGHDRLWRDDLRLVADIGVRWLRYGIPWYLVTPAPGVYDWAWTDAVLPYLVEDLGIQPIVDLIHYGAPLWLEGTFLSRDYPGYVAEYAAAVAERYGHLVRQWTPLNEPRVHAHFAGRASAWPPYRRGERGFSQVFVGLARGMALTVDAIRAHVPNAEIVHVEALSVIDTAVPALVPEVERRMEQPFLALDLVEGRVGEDHPMHAWLVRHGVDPRDLAELARPGRHMDVFGGNFYPQASCWTIDGSVERPRSRRRRGTAEDLEAAIRQAAIRVDRPVLVTETSVYGSRSARRKWLEQVAASSDRLRADRVPLLGITWFPAFSLFSWDYRRGRRAPEAYLSHMGLWDLVPDETGHLARVPTGLDDRFRELATGSGGDSGAGSVRATETRPRRGSEG
ncbi:MAG: family 1 glycosylhydrolase [Chloroflexota bacterium]